MQGHWAKPLQWCFRISKSQREGYFVDLHNSVGLTEGKYYFSDGDPEWKSQSLFQEEGLSTGNWLHSWVQFHSVTQSCLTLCNPTDYSTPGLPVHHKLKIRSTESVMPSNHLILCHPVLLPPSILPSIRVFSTESVLHIRWPNYWSFSFSSSPCNEYSGLISFRIEGMDLHAFQGTL